MLAPQDIQLETSDGIRLTALHWDPGLRDLGCVVAHGFTGSSRSPDVQAISRALAGEGAGVLSIDFRGHGRSGGRSTVGAEEIHDVAAAVAWMRAHGYARVAILGWSMGGSAVLRYAGLGGDTDAVVSVSSPARWFERGTRPMRIVHWLCETRTGRVVLRVSRRTRLDRFSWAEVVPEAPHEVAGLIAPTPLLIVHGDADHYFPLPHVHLLRESAPSAEVWIEPGMGHAESATTPDLIARVTAWLRSAESAPGARRAVGQVCDDGARD
ncbi:MAG TPA: alpha/beta fold hydrolase [Jatrophihabitantaceae bacterium]|nr:alpha/beta fold hydrolase [Jatrophihabitantaceae bacterium]